MLKCPSFIFSVPNAEMPNSKTILKQGLKAKTNDN